MRALYRDLRRRRTELTSPTTKLSGPGEVATRCGMNRLRRVVAVEAGDNTQTTRGGGQWCVGVVGASSTPFRPAAFSRAPAAAARL